MVTKVGLQSDYIAALKDLIELDYDAVEAYESAIEKLDNKKHQDALKTFKEDHERHIKELTQHLQKMGESYPTGPSAKSILTKGKVFLANIMGDKQILYAMQSNEEDTNKAYERMQEYEEIEGELKQILERGLKDEKHHYEYLKESLESMK